MTAPKNDTICEFQMQYEWSKVYVLRNTHSRKNNASIIAALSELFRYK